MKRKMLKDVKKFLTRNRSSFSDWINDLYYIYRRNGWMLDPSYFLKNKDIEIDRPIFLLGPAGGGLSLTSRMIRRNKKVVSVSGNYKYWAGADEMQLVYGPILPKELTGIKYKVPPHPEFPIPRGWLYGTDELVNHHRKTEKDATKELKEKFKKILRWTIKRKRLDKEKVRFTDKSQIYTLKVSFINELLKENNPHFILIVRNPYAMCFRAAQTKGGMNHMKDKFNFEERLKLATEHWSNLMKYSLEDKEKVKNFQIIKFEDVLKDTKNTIQKICDFTDLKFQEDMIPQKDHKIPFGTKHRDRWYPLKENINQKYLKQLTPKQIEIIEERCGKYAKQFGYKKP